MALRKSLPVVNAPLLILKAARLAPAWGENLDNPPPNFSAWWTRTRRLIERSLPPLSILAAIAVV